MNQTLKKIGNVLGILAALCLSLLLICLMVTIPVVSATEDFLDTENLREIVEITDFSGLFEGTDVNVSVEGDFDISQQTLEEITKSKMMGDFVEAYMVAILDVLDGTASDILVTEAEVDGIVEKNLYELVPIMRDDIDPEGTLTEEEISEKTATVAKEYLNGLAGVVPKAVDLGMDEMVVLGMRNLREGMLFVMVILFTVAVASLIIVCRLPRLKGFLWISISAILSACLTWALKVTFEVLKLSGAESVGFSIETLYENCVAIVITAMKNGTIGLVITGVVCGVIWFLDRRRWKNRQHTPVTYDSDLLEYKE